MSTHMHTATMQAFNKTHWIFFIDREINSSMESIRLGPIRPEINWGALIYIYIYLYMCVCKYLMKSRFFIN